MLGLSEDRGAHACAQLIGWLQFVVLDIFLIFHICNTAGFCDLSRVFVDRGRERVAIVLLPGQRLLLRQLLGIHLIHLLLVGPIEVV